MSEHLSMMDSFNGEATQQFLAERFMDNRSQFLRHGRINRDAAPVRLGTYIRAVRQSRGLSREEVAKRSHLSRMIIVALEEGALPAHHVERNWMNALATVLEVPVETLLALNQSVVHKAASKTQLKDRATKCVNRMGLKVADAAISAVFPHDWDINGRFFLPAPLMVMLVMVLFILAAIPYAQHNAINHSIQQPVSHDPVMVKASNQARQSPFDSNRWVEASPAPKTVHGPVQAIIWRDMLTASPHLTHNCGLDLLDASNFYMGYRATFWANTTERAKPLAIPELC